jgi:ribosomal protein S18 acetylase RimI-like enzyme
MQISKATENDLAGMVDLWWEMQSSHDDYDLRFYKTKTENECRDLARTYFSIMISDNNHLILLASESGKTVGMIHIQLGVKPPIYTLERFGSIQEVVVAKACRSRGIFRMLFNHAKDLLRLEKINLFEALVDVSNPATEAYEHIGFTVRQQLMIHWI